MAQRQAGDGGKDHFVHHHRTHASIGPCPCLFILVDRENVHTETLRLQPIAVCLSCGLDQEFLPWLATHLCSFEGVGAYNGNSFLVRFHHDLHHWPYELHRLS